jgi:hypothetical protein
MEENRLPRQAWEYGSRGRNSIGGPSDRWSEQILEPKQASTQSIAGGDYDDNGSIRIRNLFVFYTQDSVVLNLP